MTDWRLEVDLAVEYDWRRLANNVTGGGTKVVFANCDKQVYNRIY